MIDKLIRATVLEARYIGMAEQYGMTSRSTKLCIECRSSIATPPNIIVRYFIPLIVNTI